jgi:ATP-dependent DNA helicase DinG
MQAIMQANPKLDVGSFATGLNAWDRVEEWEDDGGRAPGRQDAISPQEAQSFLREVLGSDSEQRAAQSSYAGAATYAFQPRQRKEINNILLAEAGTGLGKTLGYLSPAYLWAKKNNAPVWISTYTKNLQRQLDQESARLIGDPDERRTRIVIRKGRENYVCLLNMQEVFGRLTSANPRTALLAALISRWARFTRDGDMVGGDFPSWILSLFNDISLDGEGRASRTWASLTNAAMHLFACPHYKRCFIERSVRRKRQSSSPIMPRAARPRRSCAGRGGDRGRGSSAGRHPPHRLRRHHLFDAADSAFSGHLTALETAELAALRGPETERAVAVACRPTATCWAKTRTAKACNRCCAHPHLPLADQAVQAGHPMARGTPEPSACRPSTRTAEHHETDCQPLVDGLAQAQRIAAALIDLKRPMTALSNALAKSSTPRPRTFRQTTVAASRRWPAPEAARRVMVGLDRHAVAPAGGEEPALRRMVRHRPGLWPRA